MRLELTALELLAPRSNQLSYKTKYFSLEKERIELPASCVQSRRSTPELLPQKYNFTNLWNVGLISADRRARPTLMLTIPRPKVKSSTKDLSLLIFEIVIQHLLRFGSQCVAILWYMSKDVSVLV